MPRAARHVSLTVNGQTFQGTGRARLEALANAQPVGGAGVIARRGEPPDAPAAHAQTTPRGTTAQPPSPSTPSAPSEPASDAADRAAEHDAHETNCIRVYRERAASALRLGDYRGFFAACAQVALASNRRAAGEGLSHATANADARSLETQPGERRRR